jgi:hypothetical protein
MDFTKGQALDPRITFSRASTSAYYYDGKTSVLAEQNLLLQSQNAFNGASWTKTSCTASDASTTAPDGTTTASTLTGTAGGYTQYIIPTTASALGISAASTVTYTYSLYLKAGTISSIRFYIYNATGGASIYGTFDLTAITGVAGGSAMTPAISITDVGNSWRRVTVTGNLNGTTGQYAVPTVYADNGTFYMWGMQAEQRSSVTAYNATTTAAITNYIPQLQSAGTNIPRFDYNPATGESLGLLIEQSSTNLVLYSEQFDNAVWGKLNTFVTSNTVIAPDGTLSGDTLTTSGAATSQRISQNVIATGSLSNSFFVKAGTARYIQWLHSTDANAYINFDTQLGVIGSKGSNASGIITPVGNGWYRCTATSTIATSNLFYLVIVASNTAGYADNFTATVASLYLWGYQLEALAFPTSYIPTTSAAATRAQDSATLNGVNFASWYNQGQGTFYVNYSRINTGSSTTYPALFTTDTLLEFADGTNEVIKSIPANRQYNAGSVTKNERKAIFVYSPTVGIGSAFDGGNYQSDSASPVTNKSTTYFTFGGVSGNPSSNYIKKIAYYPQALTSAQLLTLTG